MKNATELRKLTKTVSETFELAQSIIDKGEHETRSTPIYQSYYYIHKDTWSNIDVNILMTQLLKLGYYATIEKYDDDNDKYIGYVVINWNANVELEGKGILEESGKKYACYYSDGLFSKKEIK